MKTEVVIGLVGLILAAIGVFFTIIGIRATRRSSRPAAVEEERDRFKNRLRQLRDSQVKLGDEFLERSPREWRAIDTIPVLAKAGWILDGPQDVGKIDINLRPDPDDPSISRLRDASRALRGLSLAGNMTYSEAIRDVNPNTQYFNGIIYRPVGLDADGSAPLSMTFGVARYFDYLDTSEVLAYEATLQPNNLGVRRRITDPFDLTNRVASLGVLTLTIQRSPSGATFIMHKRSGNFAVGDALYHVVPAGEFTPADVGPAAIRADFELWRNIVREYAEELLDIPDAQGTGGRRLDYEHEYPYQEMVQAIRDDRFRLYTFGLALDPLTFKPELLTAAVIDKTVFDKIFRAQLPATEEGVVIEDIPFTEENVRDYIDAPTTRHGAKACLTLAWQYRDELDL
jgi:hypothetical protein